MNWFKRLKNAQRQNEQLKKDMVTAKEVFKVEGENKILQAQFGMLEHVQTVLVENEIKGLRAGLEKSLPEVAQARQTSGEKAMTGYINSVKSRALPQSK